MTDEHQIMLVTDAGKLIRTPVDTVRFTGRSAQGVTLFKVSDDEKVVSVGWLIEDEEDEAAEAAEGTEEGIEATAEDGANAAPESAEAPAEDVADDAEE